MVQTMANIGDLIVIPCPNLIATARRKFSGHSAIQLLDSLS